MVKSREEQAVERGVAWLNRNSPGWRDSINKDKFDINNGCNCIFGQLVGRYEAISGFGIDPWGDEAAELGFCPSYESDLDTRKLNDAWLAVI